MTAAERLLARLDAVAASVAADGHVLALLGLGSVGLETGRIDEWSDLDFFVIVEPGHKARYLDRLDWLERAHPLAWHFRNTGDGHKALMADGLFCEFAVFEPAELAQIPFAPGRVVWRRADADPALATPRKPLPRPTTDETWIVGEAIANLLVGLGRWHRGEKLSAMRFVQGHALDRLVELDALRRRAAGGGDPFDGTRRLEMRQAALAAELPRLAPGYEHTPAAAAALLDAFAARGAQLNAAALARIRTLIGD